MTLLEMAIHVCEVVGKNDPASLEACKGFLRRRHEVIYDSGLFKDLLDVFSLTVLDGSGIAVLPLEAARPLAVWDPASHLPYTLDELASVIVRDPSHMSGGAMGTLSFCEGPRTAWPFPLGDGSRLAFYNLGNPEITVGVAGFVAGSGGLPPYPVTESLGIGSGAFFANTAGTFVSIDRLSKPRTPAPVFCSGLATNQSWVWPAAMEEASFATVRLMPPPSAGKVLSCYAKKAFQQMEADTDTPMVRGSTNALLAFAQADMLERSRQYGKAQMKTGEGTAMLGVARDVDVNQSAYEARVTPQVAYLEGTEEWLGWS